MFLRCSYFLAKSEADVLINSVLIKWKACIEMIKKSRGRQQQMMMLKTEASSRAWRSCCISSSSSNSGSSISILRSGERLLFFFSIMNAFLNKFYSLSLSLQTLARIEKQKLIKGSGCLGKLPSIYREKGNRA